MIFKGIDLEVGTNVRITTHQWQGGFNSPTVTGPVQKVDANFVTVNHERIHKYDIKSVETY